MNNANAGALKPPAFAYLDKIYSTKKQLQMFDILEAIHPTHAERLFMSGFLEYVGYSYDETFKIIDEHCQWEDYDSSITAYQLSTVYKRPYLPHNGNKGNNVSKPRVRKWQLTPTEAYRIKLARSAESHRELTKWAKENDVPIYDCCPELPFNPALLEQQK